MGTEGIRERLGLERNVLVLGIASMIATFGSMTWFFFLPIYYSTNFHASVTQISIIYAGWLGAIALGTSPAGRLADIYGRKTIVVASGLISGSATFILAFFPNNFLLSAFALPLAGFGTSFLQVSRVVIAESVKTKRRGIAYGTYQTFTNIVASFSPIVGGYTIAIFGTSSYSSLFIFGGVLVLCATVIRAVLLRETLPRGVRLVNGAKGSSIGEVLGKMVRNRVLLALMIAYSLYNLLVDQYSFVVPLYIKSVLDLNYINTGLAFAILQAMIAVSRIPFGELSDRLGKRLMIALSWLGETTLVYVFVLAPVGDATQVFIGIAVWTIFGVMDAPALDAWLADATETKSRGFSMGTFYSVINVFGIPFLYLTGYLFTISPQLPFYANSALGLSALIILVVLTRSSAKNGEAVESPEPA